jgi:hypothetical protein
MTLTSSCLIKIWGCRGRLSSAQNRLIKNPFSSSRLRLSRRLRGVLRNSTSKVWRTLIPNCPQCLKSKRFWIPTRTCRNSAPESTSRKGRWTDCGTKLSQPTSTAWQRYPKLTLQGTATKRVSKIRWSMSCGVPDWAKTKSFFRTNKLRLCSRNRGSMRKTILGIIRETRQ